MTNSANGRYDGLQYTQLGRLNVRDAMRIEGVSLRAAESVQVVRAATDFPTPLSSDVVYIVDGEVDMGSTSLVVPPTGATITGFGFGVSVLSSSAASFTLLTSPDGSYSGDLFLQDIDIQVTGAGSQVFDMNNAGNGQTVEWVNTNFTSCTSLGELTAFRQVLSSNVAFIAVQDGLTLSGTWTGGAAILTTIAINLPASMTLFKEGTSLLFQGSVRSDMNALLIDDTTVIFDFQAANFDRDAGFLLSGFRSPITANAVPNIAGSSTKARFSRCSGIRNTYVGAAWTLSSAAATAFGAADTLVKMAGTTAYEDENWFSDTTSNAFVYDSTELTEVQVSGSLSFTGGAADQLGIQIRQWDDSASGYVNIGPEYVATMNGGLTGTRAENVTIFAYAALEQNDRIEVWIKNITDTTSITCEVGGYVIVSERQS